MKTKNFPVRMFIPMGIILLFFIGFSLFGNSGGTWGPMHMGYGSWMMFPGLFILIFIIMMVMMGKRGGMMNQGSHENSHNGSTDDSIGILKTRYAKGEISKKQFEEMREDLK